MNRALLLVPAAVTAGLIAIAFLRVDGMQIELSRSGASLPQAHPSSDTAELEGLASSRSARPPDAGAESVSGPVPGSASPPAPSASPTAIISGRIVGPVRDGDILSILCSSGGTVHLRLSQGESSFRASAFPVGDGAIIRYTGTAGFLPYPVTLTSLSVGENNVHIALQWQRSLVIRLGGKEPIGKGRIWAFVHRAVPNPTTAGVELHPRRWADKLGERRVRLAGLEELRVSGKLWTQDGHYAEFFDLATAAPGGSSRAVSSRRSVTWLGSGSMNVHVARSSDTRSPQLSVFVADVVYGIKPHWLPERTAMANAGARAAHVRCSKQSTTRIDGLWPVDYDVVLLDGDGVVHDWTRCRLRPKVQSACWLSFQATLLRIRNPRRLEVGFALISARQGILKRALVPMKSEQELWLPPGRYQLRDWAEDRGLGSKSLDLDLQGAPTRTVSLPLR